LEEEEIEFNRFDLMTYSTEGTIHGVVHNREALLHMLRLSRENYV